MQNIKAVLVGGLLGILATLGGVKLAHAECDIEPSPAAPWTVAALADTYADAFQDVLEGAGRGYNCEVIELQDGSFEAQCDEVSHAVESRACSAWAFGFGLGEDDGERMYEACMVVALHTGAVK